MAWPTTCAYANQGCMGLKYKLSEHVSLKFSLKAVKRDKTTSKVTRVSFQGFCEVSTAKRIKCRCETNPKPKQNRRFSYFYLPASRKVNPDPSCLRILFLPFRFLQVNTKMKFNLYIRGVRIGVKEGRLLLFGRFKWMKFHYIENTK